jgi:hypothetical protein
MDYGPFIIPLGIILFCGAMIAIGLITHSMPSGLGFVDKEKQPIAFAASAVLWGLGALFGVAILLALWVGS